jgi:hypothetical protein
LANGAAAVLVQNQSFPGSSELAGSGLRCRGRSFSDQVQALRDLRSELRPEGGVEGSVFCLARERSRAALKEALGTVSVSPAEGESFALDPFLRMARGARTVAVLGEEGTAGMIWLR